MAELAKMDVIDICVPTPLRKTKDPDLSYVVKAVEAVAATLNSRPRKTLAWKTPAEALDQLLISAMSSDVRN